MHSPAWAGRGWQHCPGVGCRMNRMNRQTTLRQVFAPGLSVAVSSEKPFCELGASTAAPAVHVYFRENLHTIHCHVDVMCDGGRLQ